MPAKGFGLPQAPVRNVDIPQDSIVVLSQEETGLSGYIHQKYAFSCLGELRLVDYYGAPLIRRTTGVITHFSVNMELEEFVSGF